MRYCKDCEHFNLAAQPGRNPYCGRFKREFTAGEHPVYGPRIEFSAPECAVARGEGGQCGTQARFYKARSGSEAWLAEREVTKAQVFAEAHEELEPARRPWWRLW